MIQLSGCTVRWEGKTMTSDLAGLSDADLAGSITRQKEEIAAFEQDFLPMRARYERLRNRLRALEGELQRRKLAEQGIVRPATRPRRSTLISDIIFGREVLDPALPDLPFEKFRFLSLTRQEIVLNREGQRAAQVIGFITPEKQPRHAHTFGEAIALRQAGLDLGV